MYVILVISELSLFLDEVVGLSNREKTAFHSKKLL